MFENYDLAERHEDLVLTPAQRKAVTFLAALNISIIWMYFFFADRPGATGMTHRSVLHGCAMLTLPFLALLLAAVLKRDFATGLFASAIVPVAMFFFPFFAFVSWFSTNRLGPMALLCPVSVACIGPAIASLRKTTGKGKFVLWTLALAFLLANYYWLGTLVYLGQKALWVPCPPNVSCHYRF